MCPPLSDKPLLRQGYSEVDKHHTLQCDEISLDRDGHEPECIGGRSYPQCADSVP
jgi:hypothetical protein